MNEEQLPDGAIVKDAGSIEDNLPMVNYIILSRIYDLLSLIANKLVGPEEVSKMVGYHEEGYLLGPDPAFTPKEAEGK
ncbi:MAG: hypothetical protein ACO3CQ_01525 [Candidatus Nanopelagicaceae bacterium]